MKKQSKNKLPRSLDPKETDAFDAPCAKCVHSHKCDDEGLYEDCEYLANWQNEVTEETCRKEGPKDERSKSEERPLCSKCGKRPVRVKKGFPPPGYCIVCYNEAIKADKFHLTFPKDSILYPQIKKIADIEFRTINSQLLFFLSRSVDDWIAKNKDYSSAVLNVSKKHR